MVSSLVVQTITRTEGQLMQGFKVAWAEQLEPIPRTNTLNPDWDQLETNISRLEFEPKLDWDCHAYK